MMIDKKSPLTPLEWEELATPPLMGGWERVL